MHKDVLSYVSVRRTQNTQIEQFLDDVSFFLTRLKPWLQQFNNITYDSVIENSSPLYRIYLFNISEYENFQLAVKITYKSGTVYDIIQGLVLKTNPTSFAIGDYYGTVSKTPVAETVDGVRQYYITYSCTIVGMTDSNNNLIVLTTPFTATNTTNRIALALTTDTSGRKLGIYIGLYASSGNIIAVYYDDEGGVVRTAKKFGSSTDIIYNVENEALEFDTPILDSSKAVIGMVTQLKQMVSTELIPQSGYSFGRLVEIDGVRHRQICNEWFVREY